MADDLSPDLFTADYTGEPGQRAFFLQARAGAVNHTFAIEKQQVQVLAEKLHEMLVAIDRNDTIAGAIPARDPALVSEPLEPEWRVGSIALAYDEPSDSLLLVMEEVTAEDQALDEEPRAARFTLRRDQVRSFVLHALAVVDEGRPLCQLCGLPKDPGGHQCPASNGHHVGV
jgi:uncharacterized repeat protein (TIGR03847 family)